MPALTKLIPVVLISIGIFSAGFLAGNYNTPKGTQEIFTTTVVKQHGPDYGIVLTYSPDPPLVGQTIQFKVQAYDRQGKAVSGATVVVGIEVGEKPMSSMEMLGGMVRVKEKEPSLYGFGFFFNLTGPYVVHVHVIPPGGEMSEMMRNHADFGPVVIYKTPPPDTPDLRGPLVNILPEAYDPRSSRGFLPTTMQVVIGVNSTVTWVNGDISSHSVTDVDGSFTSPLLNPGRSWSHRFTIPGVYRYFCNPHEWMVGTIVVLPPPI